MVKPDNKINIRQAMDKDEPFILSLSPSFGDEANLDWHSEETVQKFQYDYITEIIKPKNVQKITLNGGSGGVGN